jgi:orotidine-5'-phosphate decarboxylase
VADWIAAANADAEHYGPVGAVLGATLDGEVETWRARMPRSWFLVPGFGAQGAGPAQIRRHFNPGGHGALVVSARGVLFPKVGVDGSDWQSRVAARAQDLVDAVGDAIA